MINYIIKLPTGDVEVIRALNDVCKTTIIKPHPFMDVEKILFANYTPLGVFMDLRCEEQHPSLIFYEATEGHMYESLHNWLIFGSDLNDTISEIKDEGFGTSTDFVLAIEESTESHKYTLYDVYNPAKKRGGELNVTLYGSWSEQSSLDVVLTMPMYLRRANLHRMKLTIGTIVSITI